MINLLIEYPDGQTEEIPLHNGVFQIGRTKENDIVIVNDTISRIHAELTVTNHHLRIKDLHSSSGTLLNGKSCSFEKKVYHGDKLLLGLVKLTIAAGQKQNVDDCEDEKTRAFHKEELGEILQDLQQHQVENNPTQQNRNLIIGLCCLILALCLYIWGK